MTEISEADNPATKDEINAAVQRGLKERNTARLLRQKEKAINLHRKAAIGKLTNAPIFVQADSDNEALKKIDQNLEDF